MEEPPQPPQAKRRRAAPTRLPPIAEEAPSAEARHQALPCSFSCVIARNYTKRGVHQADLLSDYFLDSCG